MSKSRRNALLGLLLLAVVAACVWYAHGHIHFDWANLKLQMRAVAWGRVVLAGAFIWLSIVLRAPRWNGLLGKSATTGATGLIASQFIGFTVVALFGRVADLARPYLVARRTKTAVASQLAVYSIERGLDLAAAAILFSLTLVLAPHDMANHAVFKKAGLAALAGTVFIAIFAMSVRFAGGAVAGLAQRILRLVSAEFAESVAGKILDFREGLRTITSLGQFLMALAWSMAVWASIAASYYEASRAFRDCPQLAQFTVPGTMLLMAASMGGSLLQLPIVGWFTQIGVLGLAFHGLFSVPPEVASAAGALVMVVTTLGVVPAGLVAAKIEGIGLRAAARSGEAIDATEASAGQ